MNADFRYFCYNKRIVRQAISRLVIHRYPLECSAAIPQPDRRLARKPHCLMRFLLSLVVVTWIFASPPRRLQAEELRFGRPFGPGMVLQRECPITLWGTAPASAAVTVSFHGHSAGATADEAGRWEVRLPAVAASALPSSLVLSSGAEQVVIDDCLVGDVWICAGQSNMLFPLAGVENAKHEISAAFHPTLRLLPLLPPAGSGNGHRFSPTVLAALDPSRFFTGAWTECRPDVAGQFPAVPYFFGEMLLLDQQLPIGIICLAVGGSPTEAWVRRAALAAHPRLSLLVEGNWLENPELEGWCRQRAVANLPKARHATPAVSGGSLGPDHPFKPGFLWQSGLAPLLPLKVRGIAWYQGESNADSAARVNQQTDLLPLLVADWRAQLMQPGLPFVFVQLPALERPFWPAFRDCQRRLASSIPGSGMVVTIDLGDRHDVHPRDKRPVGQRLGHWAQVAVYGNHADGVASTGPLADRVTRTGTQSLEVQFTETGGGLRTTDGKPPRHFEAAGNDDVFAPISAAIVGDRIVLTPAKSMTVETIQAVRYGWRPYPDPPVNLVNAIGLPASPFQLLVERRLFGPHRRGCPPLREDRQPAEIAIGRRPECTSSEPDQEADRDPEKRVEIAVD